MENRTLKFLADILYCINGIEEFIGEPKVFSRYESNQMMQAAVERYIEIIGEAVKNLIAADSGIPISNSRKIINARNKISHGYDEVEAVQIWNIVVNHLPTLKSEVERLMNPPLK